MHSGLEAYRKSLRSNPGAFIEGARAFCKFAAADQDDESLWDKIRPWILGLGGGAILMHLGDAWGRHAERAGDRAGPIIGPVRFALNQMLPENMRMDLSSGGSNGGQGK